MYSGALCQEFKSIIVKRIKELACAKKESLSTSYKLDFVKVISNVRRFYIGMQFIERNIILG